MQSPQPPLGHNMVAGFAPVLVVVMKFPLTTDWDMYEKAYRLAVDLKHHPFDTLSHAVALQVRDSVFITAEAQYFRKAAQSGYIIELEDFSV